MFDPQVPLTVHWDGKLLPDLTARENVERLPVIVTGLQIECLLGVPKLASGTDDSQAQAVVECLKDWGICEKVVALSFDTTASNTGDSKGACVLIEKLLEKSLIHLACRHHMMEIVLEKVFTALKISGPSSGPDISLFKRFKEQWHFMEKGSYDTADGMTEVDLFKESTLQFANDNLQIRHPRDDYREFLELAVIFLGGTPPRGIHFHAPGAVHRARWMARIIYCYKMWMFKKQFKLKLSEEQGLFQLLCFVSSTYMKLWFQAPQPARAPSNDLQFLKDLEKYNSVNSVIGKAAKKAFSRHLWYLNEITVGLAFFLDENIDPKQKVQMLKNMQEKPGSTNRAQGLDSNGFYADQPISFFVTNNTKAFFSILGLPHSFLEMSPETWSSNNEYKHAEKVVTNLKVVNDTAERGVKLIQDFNEVLCRKEDQKQFLLQVVQEHRRLYPDAKKTTVVTGLAKSSQ